MVYLRCLRILLGDDVPTKANLLHHGVADTLVLMARYAPPGWIRARNQRDRGEGTPRAGDAKNESSLSARPGEYEREARPFSCAEGLTAAGVVMKRIELLIQKQNLAHEPPPPSNISEIGSIKWHFVIEACWTFTRQTNAQRYFAILMILT